MGGNSLEETPLQGTYTTFGECKRLKKRESKKDRDRKEDSAFHSPSATASPTDLGSGQKSFGIQEGTSNERASNGLESLEISKNPAHESQSHFVSKGRSSNKTSQDYSRNKLDYKVEAARSSINTIISLDPLPVSGS